MMKRSYYIRESRASPQKVRESRALPQHVRELVKFLRGLLNVSWLVKWWMKIMRSQWLVRIFCYARISVIICVSKDESIVLVSRKVWIPVRNPRVDGGSFRNRQLLLDSFGTRIGSVQLQYINSRNFHHYMIQTFLSFITVTFLSFILIDWFFIRLIS